MAHYPHYKKYGAELHPDYYSAALTLLVSEGKCEVVEILGTDYRNALQKLADCDITLGKILPNVGWFGRFELEAMVLGKPVVCYVSDQLYQKYEPPVYRTSKNTLYEDLLALISDRNEQQRLSREGSRYVKEKHDVYALAKQLDGYYEGL
ncbi:MAG: glycosyltransferase [Nitrososphaera sp.]